MTNLLVPLAGSGKRFADAGYAVPKPLIPVNGVPMVKFAVNNVLDSGHGLARLIFVVADAYTENKRLTNFLWSEYPSCRIVATDPTRGAAETCLKAVPLIDNDGSLLIFNCDQFVRGGVGPLCETDGDAAVLTMKADGSKKWSYAKSHPQYKPLRVEQIAEKEPISDRATTGHYWWRKGSDFVRCANEMIDADDRVNNEFYVAPVLNYLIRTDGAIVREVPIESYGGEFFGLGTPEDLRAYLERPMGA